MLVHRAVQRPVAGGCLFGGEVRDQVGHPVGRQPNPHVPPRPRGTRPDLGLLGRGLHGEAGGQVVDPPHAEPLDRLRREPPVDRGPLRAVEVRSRGDDFEDLVLGQLPGGEQPPHVVESEVQVPRRVQAATSVKR